MCVSSNKGALCEVFGDLARDKLAVQAARGEGYHPDWLWSPEPVAPEVTLPLPYLYR